MLITSGLQVRVLSSPQIKAELYLNRQRSRLLSDEVEGSNPFSSTTAGSPSLV